MVSSAAAPVKLTEATSHLEALDGFRGVLALTICLLHFGLNPLLAKLTGGFLSWAPWGYVVDVFFMLSGFVLTRAYMRRARNLKQMFAERVFRLLPVHIIIIVIGLVVYLAMKPKAPEWIVADVLAMSIYFGQWPWNGPAWSINIELYMPILLFLSVGAVARLSARTQLAALTLMLLIASAVALLIKVEWTSLMLLRGAIGLAAGGLLYHVKQADILRLPKLPPLFALLVIFYVLMLAAGKFLPVMAVLPWLAALMIWAGSSDPSVLGRGPFWFLGYISYTLYMVHHLVLDTALHHLGPDALEGNITLKLMLITASFAAALLLTWLVERPGMALGRRVSHAIAGGSPRPASA